MRGWWGQERVRAKVRLGPWPNEMQGTGAQHAICGLEIKLVSVMDDHNHMCTHGVKAKPDESEKVRNCHYRSHEHDTETSHM